jgi:glyoxylase-like metal-dependent hydrolase (beta-lactamase superfamily II)
MAKCILETPRIMVLQAQLGEWDNLNHLLVCKNTKKAAIIDPFFAEYWLDVCETHGWELEQVWLTHSHWDHSKGVEGLADRQVWVHSKESERGWEGPSNREWNNAANSHVIQTIGVLEIEAHCTPGHTPGHMTFIGEGVVVSGDCMFLGRCGRTDLFGGDIQSQRSSLLYLRKHLKSIPGDWLVLPGHQYKLPDGTNPTYISVDELLINNEALKALDDDLKWDALDFLAFDDSLAEKARRESARAQNL